MPNELPSRSLPSPSPISRTDWLTDESFRTLRTNVMTHFPEGSGKTIAITSSRPQEGKSTVAVNLACSLSAIGKRALLVDADLRRPRIHDFFGVDNGVGFADVLSGRSAPRDAFHELREGPTLLTSGTGPEDPQKLLLPEALDDTFKAFTSQFDYVIIDTAPYLAVADTSLIAPRVDGVIFVLRYAVVTEAEARRTKSRLDAVGSKIIGAVVNGIESSAPDYYHPYSSEYARADRD